MRRSGRFCGCVVLLLAAIAGEARAIPADELLRSLRPTADVNDYANLLTPAEKAALEARCRELRERTGAQLAVVTLQTLDGGEIEDFTNKLFARWGVGQKDKKNGLMLLVAMEDRKSRIEVGYGLEPIIPDMLAGRILDHQLKPAFRQGKYAAGLAAAVDELCELVERGEPADQKALERAAELSLGEKLMMVMFLAVFVAIGGFLFGIGLGAQQSGALMTGAMFGGLPMLIGLSVASPWSLGIHIPIALATAILGWGLANRFNQPGKRRFGRKDSEPFVWNWGDSSGSSGGWSSGGGGFSQGWGGFGGGSSGGGGASGGW